MIYCNPKNRPQRNCEILAKILIFLKMSEQNFDLTINEGLGWLICKKDEIVAFASRYPKDRISLLYCKGDSQRKGYGTKLLLKLEKEAKEEGLTSLYTEASLISYKLFLRNKWEIIRKEKINIKSIIFERYKMIKIF